MIIAIKFIIVNVKFISAVAIAPAVQTVLILPSFCIPYRFAHGVVKQPRVSQLIVKASLLFMVHHVQKFKKTGNFKYSTK